MRALFDVHVLIALDTDHVGHPLATAWFAAQLAHGWPCRAVRSARMRGCRRQDRWSF